MATISPEVDALVHAFAARLTEVVSVQARERVLAAVASVLAVSPSGRLAGTLKQAPGAERGSMTRPPLRLSAEALAIRKRQGKYLGVLRGLAPAARERVRAMAKEKGVAAAITFAKSLR